MEKEERIKKLREAKKLILEVADSYSATDENVGPLETISRLILKMLCKLQNL